jgi:hypothetical protein
VRLAGRVLREWDPVKIRAVLDSRREADPATPVHSAA